MKYKQNVREKFDGIDAIVARLQFQVGRNVSRQELEVTLESLKEKLDETKHIIELEVEDFVPRS